MNTSQTLRCKLPSKLVYKRRLFKKSGGHVTCSTAKFAASLLHDTVSTNEFETDPRDDEVYRLNKLFDTNLLRKRESTPLHAPDLLIDHSSAI